MLWEAVHKAIEDYVRAKARHEVDIAQIKAEMERIEAEQRAVLEHRPWWWRLTGRTHLAPSR